MLMFFKSDRKDEKFFRLLQLFDTKIKQNATSTPHEKYRT